MDIEKGPENLADLFQVRKISIPSFQRNYVWKEENIKQLLSDLVDASNQSDPHFFGPVILRKKGNGAIPEEYEVIDGQQRLTTSVLVLAVLREIAKDAKYFPSPLTALVDAVTQYLKAPGALAGSRFKASPLIRDFFDSAVVVNPPTRNISDTRGMGKQLKEDTKWVRKGYLAIDAYLRDAMDQLNTAAYENFVLGIEKAVTEKFQIHSLVVQDEADAYRLFESMNYLGMKLDPGDLLKSLVLRRVHQHSPSELNAAVTKWDDMWSHISGGVSVSKFLRHYLLSTESGKVKASHIYPTLKNRIMSSPNAANLLLEELKVNANAYGALIGLEGSSLGDAALDQAAKRMNLISDTHKLLLLAILRHTDKAGWRKQAFRAVEYAVFRKVASRENAQDIETSYQNFAKKFRDVSDQTELDDWCHSLIAPLHTDQQLRDLPINNCTFVGIQYDPREDLARYANAVYEMERGAGWAEKPTLEHLAPQKPAAASGWQSAGVVGSVDNPYEVQIHWWGNLTSLEQPLNSSIGNGEWSKKVNGNNADHSDGLRRSGFESTKQVCKSATWTEATIHDRGKWLLESLLTLRSKNWVLTGNSNATSVAPWI